MKIHLPSTLTYYINLEKEKANAGTTKNILKRLEFTDYRRAPGFPTGDPVSGTALAHLNVLQSLQHQGNPFIVFEDDIEVNKFIKTISVPEDADAVYLGLSCMGLYNGKDEEQVSAEKETRNVSRIYNMLATHAIVYINPDYVKSVIKAVEFCKDRNMPLDIGIADNMKFWNVYGMTNPMFYQRGKYERYTNLSLTQMNVVPAEKCMTFKYN